MKPVKVYVTTFCPYCVRAKQLLSHHKVPYEEVNVSGDDDRRRWLVEQTGQRTVPQIFFGEEPIGGYTELAALTSRGELMQRLAD
jgi:glutaredoxin 3